MHAHRNPFNLTALSILVLMATLMGIGAVMIFSASATLEGTSAARSFLRQNQTRQLAFSILGFVVALASSMIPYQWFRIRGREETCSWFQPTLFLLLVTVVLLVAVLIPGIGIERNGSRRWLSFGPASYGIGFQPSEVAKVSLVLFVAGWYGRRESKPGLFFRGLLPAVLAVALCAGLVGLEDFGTAVLLLTVGGMLLLAAGSRPVHLAMMALPALAAVVAMLYMKPYRMERLTAHLHIWDDPGGKGYHAVQSLCSIASGGWWGTGLGAGLQKYGYLPEARTDFIFAIVCEELGIAGGLVIIGLFMVFIWQGRKAALAAPDMFGRLLALGVTLTIGLQAAMNIAVVTVTIPTKGIALPLISAGGSGALFLGAAIGLLASVGRAGAVWRDWLSIRYDILSGQMKPPVIAGNVAERHG